MRWNQNRIGGYGYGGMQQPQFQGRWGNAQQSQWGGGYQPQQNFGGWGGSPFGGGQQWQGGGQNWGGGYGYNQPQQQPYFGGMMGYQPEQRQSYGQFNQPQQGQYNQGGNMGFKSQGMNQDRRAAYSNAMSQGNQQFQSQMGQQDQGQQGLAQAFNKNQGGQQREEGPDGGNRMAAGGMDKSAMIGAMQSAGQQDQSGNQYAPGQQISAATQQYSGGQGNEIGRSGGNKSEMMAAMQQFSGQGQQQMNGGNQTYGSMMGKFSGGGWR